MRIKKSLMLATPALLAAVTLGPVTASTSQALADTTATSVQTSTHAAPAPPKDRQKQYNRGRNSGYMEGRADCRANNPYSLQRTSGGGYYQRGFMDGYNEGFHSCTPTR
ncbi:hypothetical protein [Nonomuraea sp. NPDC050786]|uniref:hypothetical protein n=1 Tax=Nonomuraea sp. NPDC050786 TaxID=3154840 RepID=UPI003401B5EA